MNRDELLHILSESKKVGIRANLSGVNLSGLDLRRANLSGVNLSRANLRWANLRWANLSGVDLIGADLRGLDLNDAYSNNKEIKSLKIFEEYDLAYTSDRLQVGCENHGINEWWEFDDEQILEMDGEKALKFWRKNKELIKQIIEQCPATATGHEELKQ